MGRETVFILDRSGAMARLAGNTIGGFRSMSKKWKRNIDADYQNRGK